MKEIGRQHRQPLKLLLRPAVLDRHIAALDIAGLAQALAEGIQPARVPIGRRAAKVADQWHRRLLGARRQRPSRRAAEDCDKLPSPHGVDPAEPDGALEFYQTSAMRSAGWAPDLAAGVLRFGYWPVKIAPAFAPLSQCCVGLGVTSKWTTRLRSRLSTIRV